MLVAFQKVQAVTILQWVVVIVEKAFSRLDVLLNFSPISLHDLLCATSDGFRSLVFFVSLLRLPIVRSSLSNVVFCLDFNPFLV